MSAPRLSLPAAIVIAGALVGLGLFFGLRNRAPEALSPPSSGEHTRAAGEERRPASAPAAADVAARVATALDAQRPALAKKCWNDGAAAPPGTKAPHWVLDYTVGPDGHQLARGIQEQRGTGSAAITRCLFEGLHPVTIAPPGTAVRVDVPFSLP